MMHGPAHKKPGFVLVDYIIVYERTTMRSGLIRGEVITGILSSAWICGSDIFSFSHTFITLLREKGIDPKDMPVFTDCLILVLSTSLLQNILLHKYDRNAIPKGYPPHPKQ